MSKTKWPIIANCNYESSEMDHDIHEIRIAVERHRLDEMDTKIGEALDQLEETLSEHAESGSVPAVEACRRAEKTVREGWAEIGRNVWRAADSRERRRLAEHAQSFPGWPTCECAGCDDCTHPATHKDEGGNPCCEDCEPYLSTGDGEIICARQTKNFTRCHECGEQIEWGSIQTQQSGSGQPNYRIGTCGCGEAWIDEDRGGWGHYGYSVEEVSREN